MNSSRQGHAMVPAVRYFQKCRQRMEPGLVHVRFVVNKETLEQVFILVLQSSSVSIFRICISFI